MMIAFSFARNFDQFGKFKVFFISLVAKINHHIDVQSPLTRSHLRSSLDIYAHRALPPTAIVSCVALSCTPPLECLVKLVYVVDIRTGPRGEPAVRVSEGKTLTGWR